eukprot:11578062-Ditylum_brightwellii.AAC.1
MQSEVHCLQSDMQSHTTLLKNYLDEKPDTKASELTKHLAKQDHWPELDLAEKPTSQMSCCKLEFDILYQANP